MIFGAKSAIIKKMSEMKGGVWMFGLIRCIIDPSRISRLLEYYKVIPKVDGMSEIESIDTSANGGSEKTPKDYEIGE